MMRVPVSPRAALLVLGTLAAGLLAGALAAVGPATAAPAAGLVLGPDHGSAGTTITAQFRTEPREGRACGRTRITFSWDGRAIGRATLSSGCVATARFRPPKKTRAAGPHEVAASGAGVKASATFTIGGVAATPTRTPTAVRSENLAPVPVIPAAPASSAASLAAVPNAVAPVKTSESSGISVPLLLGGLLVLAGGGTLTAVILRSRRKVPEF